MKTLREMLAMPILWVGMLFTLVSFKIGGYDFGANFLEEIQKSPFKRKSLTN